MWINRVAPLAFAQMSFEPVLAGLVWCMCSFITCLCLKTSYEGVFSILFLVAQGNPDEIALDEDSEEEDTTNQESTSLAPPSEIMPIPAQSTNEESEPEIKKRKEV
jgi:hypothetical protein